MYSTAHFVSHLRRANVGWLIDVGANTGQFASDVFTNGYQGRVISFEPLSQAHADLVQNAKGNSRWEVASRCALGGAKAVAKINIAGNSYSSSLRPMLDAHLSAAPESAYIGSEEIEVQTLAAFLEWRFPAGIPQFALKIDTQGSETEVLDGLGTYLDRCVAVLLEMPLDSLYAGAADLPSLFTRLRGSGFRCVGMSPGHKDPRTGDCIEVDGLFIRPVPNPKPSEFLLFTSIPPRLSGDALRYQRDVIASWRAVGFTPISVNGPSEIGQVEALDLNIKIEPLPTDGKPIIGEVLSVISRSGRDFAGLINADCKMLCYPQLALALQARLNESVLYAERMETLGGLPAYDYCCHGFDAFFFDIRAILGISDNKFRMGETWWDYWLPLRLAANGAKIANIHQPLLLHERHPVNWSDDQWRNNAESFWQDLKEWSDPKSLPPTVAERLGLAEMGEQAGFIAMVLFDWLRNQRTTSPIRLLPPEYADLERFSHIDRQLPKIASSAAEATLALMLNSKSWKMTAPLRVANKMVRKLKRYAMS